MLKLKCIECKNGLHWFDFYDEHTMESWNGRTFNKINDAINYAKENENNNFDIEAIDKYYPDFIIEKRNY